MMFGSALATVAASGSRDLGTRRERKRSPRPFPRRLDCRRCALDLPPGRRRRRRRGGRRPRGTRRRRGRRWNGDVTGGRVNHPALRRLVPGNHRYLVGARLIFAPGQRKEIACAHRRGDSVSGKLRGRERPQMAAAVGLVEGFSDQALKHENLERPILDRLRLGALVIARIDFRLDAIDAEFGFQVDGHGHNDQVQLIHARPGGCAARRRLCRWSGSAATGGTQEQ